MEFELRPIYSGIYRHYKGPLYFVFGYGHDANIEGRKVVIYMGLQLDGAKQGPRLAVREVEDFFSLVETGEYRFTYLGPEWKGEGLS